MKDLNQAMKDLLWNICNQKEKVNGNIVSLVNLLYADRSEAERVFIIEKLKEKLKNI